MGEGTFGYTTIGGSNAYFNKDFLGGNVYQPPADGVASQISIYTSLSGGSIKCALYEFVGDVDGAGVATFLEKTVASSVAALGWHDLALLSPTIISKDKLYWIVWASSSPTYPRYDGTKKRYTYGCTYDTWCSPVSLGVPSTDRQYSLYVTYDLDPLTKNIEETLYAYRNI